MSQAGTLNRAVVPPGTGVQDLTGNSGGPVGPDGANNINILGSGIITVAGNPGTNTLTISATGEGTTITGDSGGPLSPTAGNWNFTGGSTGLTFAGAVSTETLTGTLIVGNGGTGATTLTSHGVLLGNTTSPITATAAGTTGQVLTGVTGSAPTFQSPAASSISITGDSGGALTGNAFTFTGGSTGLTFAGAGSTETVGGTLVVSNGGTGRASSTAYAVICGGTTSTAAQQSVAALGASGTVLTSNGAGSLPTFQSAAGGSISITGDSGGALSGSAFTFTGGSTGLTFAGAGSTETLGGTLAIANGGTNATLMSTSTGIVKYDGTRLVTSSTAKIDSSNRQTNTSQPSFNVYLSTSPTNVTGDGTGYFQPYDTKVFDQGSNFTTGAGAVFTAPVTGIYHFSYTVAAGNLSVTTTSGIAQLVTTAQNYLAAYMNYFIAGAANNIYQAVGSWTVPMTAGDTAKTVFYVFNGTKTVQAVGGQGNTSFSGYLVC